MDTREIILVDDKPYGLPQVEGAIPADRRHRYEVTYFDTFAAYAEQRPDRSPIVLLDYFLDKDGTYGTQVAARVQADVLIGFSSVLGASQAIVEAVRVAVPEAQRPALFAVQKLRGPRNPALIELFRTLL